MANMGITRFALLQQAGTVPVAGDTDNVSGALGQSVPAFNALSESMPDAISLARATSDAATYVQQAQSSLSGVDGSNIAAALDAVSGQLNSASTTFTRMSPGLSTMAAKILARSV